MSDDPSAWFAPIEELPLRSAADEELSADDVLSLQQKAAGVYASRVKKFALKGSATRDEAWLTETMSAGTSGDKIAALALLVRDAPLYRARQLSALLALAKKKNRTEALMAMQALNELCTTKLLPARRKLRLFGESARRVTRDAAAGNDALCLFHYEHQLKLLVGEYVALLAERAANDTVAHVRLRATQLAGALLADVPEREADTLRVVVHALGDVDRRVCASAARLLARLLEPHPLMKRVVVGELERQVFESVDDARRAAFNARVTYYGVAWCANLRYHDALPDDAAAADAALQLYLAIFRRCVARAEVESRLLSLLLVGVRRALPYATDATALPALDEHLATLFELAQTASYPRALQALYLLYRVIERRRRDDAAVDRFYAALYALLVSPGLAHAQHRAERLLNLTYLAMRADTNVPRVVAFVKRLLQLAALLDAPLACGVLVMLGALFGDKPALRALVDSESGMSWLVDDEAAGGGAATTTTATTATTTTTTTTTTTSTVYPYKPHVRDPRYANAERCALWELSVLTRHVHPSVRVYARRLLDGDKLAYEGDAVADHQLIAFLERFVGKQPKARLTAPRIASHSGHDRQWQRRSATAVPALADADIASGAASIRADERFFARFFAVGGAHLKKHKAADDDDDDEDDDDNELDDVEDSWMSQASDRKLAGELDQALGGYDNVEFEQDDDDDDDDAALTPWRLQGRAADEWAASDDDEEKLDDGKKSVFADADEYMDSDSS